MKSFFARLRGALGRLVNPPWHSHPFFLVESLHLARAYYVAAELGVADLVEQQPRDADELAAATGSDSRALYRMLRTLAGFGVFAEDRCGRFHLTRRARVLLSDRPGSLRSWLIFMGRRELWQSFACTLEAVKTGLPAFELAHGQGFYEYLAGDPAFARTFVGALGDWSDWHAREIVKAFDFSPYRAVIDVGGGTGRLLRVIMAAHPRIRGVLFDQPDTIRLAEAEFQSPDLQLRCDLIGGCFHESVPAGADAFVLKHVIYDWPDQAARQILHNCHRAMGPDAKLLIMEGLVDPRNGSGRVSKLLDLEMGALLRGGHRTADEMRDLLASCGFRIAKIHTTGVLDLCIVEACKAAPPAERPASQEALPPLVREEPQPFAAPAALPAAEPGQAPAA